MRLKRATSWTGPKHLTDRATLADKNLKTTNSHLNYRQEMLQGNQSYLNKKVIVKAKTCNPLDRTQVLK